MLILSIGFVLTTALILKAGAWSRRHAAELGSMSDGWVASNNASRPT